MKKILLTGVAVAFAIALTAPFACQAVPKKPTTKKCPAGKIKDKQGKCVTKAKAASAATNNQPIQQAKSLAAVNAAIEAAKAAKLYGADQYTTLANVNEFVFSGNSPLAAAATYGHKNVAQALIDAGALVELGKGRYMTPLVQAAAFGKTDIVTMLIKANANVNATSDTGDTVLMNAILGHQPENIDIITALIKAGANVNATDKNKSTALHLAAEQGKLKTVQLLIEAKADPNIQDKNGITLLAAAIIRHRIWSLTSSDEQAMLNRNNLAIITSLVNAMSLAAINAKLSPNAKEFANKTALDIAMQLKTDHRFDDVIALLKSKGAVETTPAQ